MCRPQYEGPPSPVSSLGQPITFPFSQRTAKNRFAKAAMSERMSSWSVDDRSGVGIPSKALINLYARWGEEGDIGVLVTGTISVDVGYMEGPGNSLIPQDAPMSGTRFESFSQLAHTAKSHGSLIVGQLNNQGRQTQAALNPDPMSASDVHLEKNELNMKYNKPHPASEQEIRTVIESFRHGAEYLEAAGFDGVQVNAAHGYIFSQFLSPSTNKRVDIWGGSLQNRVRLLILTLREIRQSCSPTFLLSVKLNCVEFESDGLKIDEVKQICLMLEAENVDMIELSGGTYGEWGWKHVRPSTAARECYFIEEAEQIKPLLTKTKLYATGGWKSAGAMSAGLRTLDGIGLARTLAQDPTLCRDILNNEVKGATKQDLDQSNYALTAVLAGTQMRAMSEGREPLDGSKPETSTALLKSLNEFMEARRSDGFGNKYGHMDMSSAVPYATSQH